MTFSRKLLLIGSLTTAVPIFAFGVAVDLVTSRSAAAAHAANEAVSLDGLRQVVDLTTTASRVYQDALEHQTRQSLAVARDVVLRHGGVTFDGPSLRWTAIDQVTRAPSTVTLPGMRIGGRATGQVSSPALPAPLVDEVERVVGSRCTLFQRMNADGDMLRVATNVIGKDGSRAIGTYIPARNADGTASPVIAAVLAGRTFVGRALVVDGYFVTAYEPIVTDGRVVGMLFVGVAEKTATDRLRAEIARTRFAQRGRAFVLNASGPLRGHMVVSPDGDADGSDQWDAVDGDGQRWVQTVVTTATALQPDERGEHVFVVANADGTRTEWTTLFRYFRPWDWVIAVRVPTDDLYAAGHAMEASAAWTRRFLVAITVASVVIGGLAWWRIATRLSSRVALLVSRLGGAATSVSSASREVADASQSLATASSTQVVAATRATSALDEVASATRQNAEAADAATALAAASRSAADAGARAMADMTEAMSSITVSGDNVARIVRVIDEMALQTNLLALNAAVEAARAGDSGLGFAVVASEVRSLAQRSTDAARETAAKIEETIASGQRGALITDDLRVSLSALVGDVRDLAAIVERIAQASSLQRRGIEHISGAVSTLHDLGRGAAASAEESAAAAQRLRAQSASLNGIASELAAIFGQGAGSVEGTGRDEVEHAA